MKLSTFRKPASAIAFLAIFLPSVANAAAYADDGRVGSLWLSTFVVDVFNIVPEEKSQGWRAAMDQRVRDLMEQLLQ